MCFYYVLKDNFFDDNGDCSGYGLDEVYSCGCSCNIVICNYSLYCE